MTVAWPCLQVATDRVQKEFNLLNEKVQKLHHHLEDQIHTNTQLLAENGSKALELKQKEDEIGSVKVSMCAAFLGYIHGSYQGFLSTQLLLLSKHEHAHEAEAKRGQAFALLHVIIVA